MPAEHDPPSLQQRANRAAPGSRELLSGEPRSREPFSEEPLPGEPLSGGLREAPPDADPGRTDPGRTEPAVTEPGLADPGLADPGLARPGLAGPAVTEPDLVGRGAAPGLPASGIDLARSALAAARARVREQPREASRRRRTPSRRSGSGPDDRDPVPFGAALRRLVTDRGWETDVAAGGVLGRWTDLAGPELAEHVQAESFDDGLLVLRADSTAWATQVRLLTATLVARVEVVAGPGSVRRLVVRGPDAPSWKHGPRGVRDGRGPRDTYG